MLSQSQGKPFYFDDLVVGAEHAAGTYVVTAQAIIEFAQIWDPQPWHVDEAFAATSIFGGLTACSAHIFSIFCITSQRWESGVVQQVIAGLGFDEMRMHKPVYCGDTLRSLSTVEAARLSRSKPDRGVATYNTQLINQNDEMVFSIKASTLMARDPAR
ncbi:MAG: MaoC/PaaZ C-terminal domain-containing protein [Halioglobus sp.]|nr:MaoC/PaaZ C-terminal domain-containing protein [Halioglobus sp.]